MKKIGIIASVVMVIILALSAYIYTKHSTAECGKTFFLINATSIVSTLPAVEAATTVSGKDARALTMKYEKEALRGAK